MNEFDVKMGRVVRNGILAGLALLLCSMTTCWTASKHYAYLDRELEQTRYLVTRPW